MSFDDSDVLINERSASGDVASEFSRFTNFSAHSTRASLMTIELFGRPSSFRKLTCGKMARCTCGICFSLLLFLLAACMFVIFYSPRGPPSNTIGFQLHSWDDMRAWPAGLNKGAQWIKVDLHFVPPKHFDRLCAPQHSFTEPGLVDASTLAFHRRHGCLLTVHNSPVASNKNYNTSADVLRTVRLLAQDGLLPLPGGQEFVVSLCFKLPDLAAPCIPGTDEHVHWLKLVDDFVEHGSALLAELPGLNINFVLDGAASPGGTYGPRPCLKDRWRPWNSTFIPFNDFYARRALVSNDPDWGYDRFQVMNLRVADPPFHKMSMISVAAQNYGKFYSNTTKYSWLAWEPENQIVIRDVLGVYLSKGVIHEPGFRLAVNIDPAQLQVFASREMGTGWGGAIIPKAKEWSVTAIFPLTETAAPDFKSQVVVVAHSPGNGWVMAVQALSQISEASSSDTVISAPLPFPMGPFPGQNDSTVWLNDLVAVSSFVHPSTSDIRLPPLIVASEAARSARFAVFKALDSTLQSIKVIAIGAYDSSGSCAFRTLATAVINGSFVARLTSSLTVGASCTCKIAIQLYAVRQGALRFLEEHCLFTEDVIGQTFAGQRVTGSVSAAFSSANSSGCFESDSGHSSIHQICVLASLAGSNTGVWYAAASLDAVHPERAIIYSSTKALHVGASPSLSATTVVSDLSASHIVIAAVFEDGYCWNSAARNKDAGVSLCDNTPVPMKGVLGYTIGRFSEWAKRINSSQVITSCDLRLQHGSFSLGTKAPVMTIQAAPGAVGSTKTPENVRITTAHIGLSDYRDLPETSLECGKPERSQGILLDGWGTLVR